MGFSGTFGWSWSAEDGDDEADLEIEVHDSDIATVRYLESELGAGHFFLGFQPRDYFEDETASEPIDLDDAAYAFCAWVGLVIGLDLEPAQVRPLMAESYVEEPPDVFVEAAVARLLDLIGLDRPDDLTWPE